MSREVHSCGEAGNRFRDVEVERTREVALSFTVPKSSSRALLCDIPA